MCCTGTCTRYSFFSQSAQSRGWLCTLWEKDDGNKMWITKDSYGCTIVAVVKRFNSIPIKAFSARQQMRHETFDSLIPLSFKHVRVPCSLKSTLQQAAQMSCVIEILFSLMNSGMVLMVVCWRYWTPVDANGYVSMLMNVIYACKNLKWMRQKRK